MDITAKTSESKGSKKNETWWIWVIVVVVIVVVIAIILLSIFLTINNNGPISTSLAPGTCEETPMYLQLYVEAGSGSPLNNANISSQFFIPGYEIQFLGLPVLYFCRERHNFTKSIYRFYKNNSREEFWADQTTRPPGEGWILDNQTRYLSREQFIGGMQLRPIWVSIYQPRIGETTFLFSIMSSLMNPIIGGHRYVTLDPDNPIGYSFGNIV